MTAVTPIRRTDAWLRRVVLLPLLLTLLATSAGDAQASPTGVQWKCDSAYTCTMAFHVPGGAGNRVPHIGVDYDIGGGSHAQWILVYCPIATAMCNHSTATKCSRNFWGTDPIRSWGCYGRLYGGRYVLISKSFSTRTWHRLGVRFSMHPA